MNPRKVGTCLVTVSAEVSYDTLPWDEQQDYDASASCTQTACTLALRANTNRHKGSTIRAKSLPMGSMVVPFRDSYLGSYTVIPKRNYFGAFG